MSYVLTAYAVEISNLQSIVGSNDASLVEAVMANNPEEFELDEDDDWDDEDDDDELSLAAALRQLVMSEEKDPEEAHQYGYALQEICDYCGELMPSDCWGGVRWEAVQQCGLEALLTKSGAPVDLPPTSDFPAIGHIQRADIDQHLQAAAKLAESTQDTEIQDLLVEYVSWLKAAASKGVDVVFFYQ